MPEFESLLDDNMQDSNIATERYASSLIENFDHSEFIKNVIMQAKKQGGTRFGSPGQNNSITITESDRHKNPKSFMKDMKKHGILKAFNDINKFTEFFQNSSSINQDSIEANSKSHNHCSSGNLECENHDSSIQNIAESAQSKNTKSTYILEEMKNEKKHKQNNGNQKVLKSFKFMFPFQRRARSHSPPKNDVITNKIISTLNNQSPDGILAQSSIHKENEKGEVKNKAIVPNPNFLIGSYHLLNKKDKPESYISKDNEEHIFQGKEVEEWLMGSGLSIPEGTTGCTDSDNKLFSSNLS